MFKILQASLQEYVSCELPDVQAGFRKGRGTRDKIANTCWIMEKAREFQKYISIQFSCSVCPTLCDPMDLARQASLSTTPRAYSNSSLWVVGAFQASHPLLFPSPPTFNLFQCQSLFQWTSSSHKVTKVLAFQLYHEYFQWIFRTDFF